MRWCLSSRSTRPTSGNWPWACRRPFGSDTLTEQGANGQVSAYYRAQVRLDPEQARAQPNPKLADVALKPGMTATVDIRTGQRSVLKYLAKPVYKAFAGAMNER